MTKNKPNFSTKGEYAKYLYEEIEHICPDYFSMISSLDDDIEFKGFNEFEPYLDFMERLLNAHQSVQYEVFGKSR